MMKTMSVMILILILVMPLMGCRCPAPTEQALSVESGDSVHDLPDV